MMFLEATVVKLPVRPPPILHAADSGDEHIFTIPSLSTSSASSKIQEVERKVGQRNVSKPEKCLKFQSLNLMVSNFHILQEFFFPLGLSVGLRKMLSNAHHTMFTLQL